MRNSFVSAIALLPTFLVASVSAENPLIRLRNQDDSSSWFGRELEDKDASSPESFDDLHLDDERVWMRLLQGSSMYMSMSMYVDMEMSMGVSCVPDDVPEFVIDDDVDVGDTMIRPGPAFAKSCGKDCIRVMDNGDDPPFDPELGDTLRFAYKETSGDFSIQSRVCGVNCDSDGYDGIFGRTGLSVRESLDPFARNVFVSHSPNAMADWSYRTEPGGDTVFGEDGSPDVPCLWITLEREGNDFTFSYAYESNQEGGCKLDGELVQDLTQTVTIDMPDAVLVGLVVSSKAPTPPFCVFTTADFRDIECRDC